MSFLNTSRPGAMLPSYQYGNSYGRRKGGLFTAANISLVVTSTVCLGLLIGLLSSRSRASNLEVAKKNALQDLDNLRTELSLLKNKLSMKSAEYDHLEANYAQTQRRLLDSTSSLSRKEQELQQKEQLVQQHLSEKDALTQRHNNKDAEISHAAWTIEDLRKQLTESDAVIEALELKMRNMEDAHKNREEDWHKLANNWIQYEKDLHEHSKKLGEELAKSKGGPVPAAVPDPSLPPVEPHIRPESDFGHDNVQIPKHVAHHWDAAVPGSAGLHNGGRAIQQEHLPQQGQQQQHFPQQAQQQHQAGQQQPAQQQQQPAQQQQHAVPTPVPSPESQDTLSHAAPNTPTSHHHHVYHGNHYDEEHHDEHHYNHHYDHYDPLDSYWVNDGHGDGGTPPHHDSHYGGGHHDPHAAHHPAGHEKGWKDEHHGSDGHYHDQHWKDEHYAHGHYNDHYNDHWNAHDKPDSHDAQAANTPGHNAGQHAAGQHDAGQHAGHEPNQWKHDDHWQQPPHAAHHPAGHQEHQANWQGEHAHQDMYKRHMQQQQHEAPRPGGHHEYLGHHQEHAEPAHASGEHKPRGDLGWKMGF